MDWARRERPKTGAALAQKAELSGMKLMAGRGALAERLPSAKALPALRITHLERLCGGPMFLA
jgi:hypothetical protein